jgi:hypothetical protein
MEREGGRPALPYIGATTMRVLSRQHDLNLGEYFSNFTSSFLVSIKEQINLCHFELSNSKIVFRQKQDAVRIHLRHGVGIQKRIDI